MDLASLNIEVKSTGVAVAARALDSLIKVATSGDAAIRNIASSLGYLRTQDFTGFAKNVQALNNALRGTTGGFKEFVNSASSLNKVSTSFTAIASATDRLSGNSAGLSAIADQLDRIRNSLIDMKGSAGVLNKIGSGDVSTRSTSGGGVSRPTDTAGLTQSQSRVIAQLEREAYLVNHTKAQWLEYRAAQAGVTSQAQGYINTLRTTTQATNTLGMTQKGYNAALRGVPAQFTDIIVSLKGGQAPLTVLLQQGGQLKDMFGGTGNAMKALGGYLLTLLTPLNLVIAASAVLAYNFWNAVNTSDKLVNALGVTNGYLGITKDTLISMGNQSGVAAEALTVLATSGKVTGSNINKITEGVINFAKATGKKIPEAAEEFMKLAENPSRAIATLNEQYHFLTLEVYNQITALEKQGRKQEAATLAQTAFADASAKMNAQTNQNLSALGNYFKDLKEGLILIKDQWNSLFYSQTEQEKLWNKQTEIYKAQNELFESRKILNAAILTGNEAQKKSLQQALVTEDIRIKAKIAGLQQELDLMQSGKKIADDNAKQQSDELVRQAAAIANQKKLDDEKEKQEKARVARAKSEAEALKNKLNKLREEADSIGQTIEQMRLRGMLARGEILTSQLLTDNEKKLAAEKSTLVTMEKNSSAASAIAAQRLVIARQQSLVIEEKLTLASEAKTKEDEKQVKLADDLRAKYGSQMSLIDGKLDKARKEIESAKTLGDEASRMIKFEEESAKISKEKLIAEATNDPMRKVQAEYEAKLFAIQQLGLAETEQTLAIDALKTETENKRVLAFQQQLSQQSLLSKMMVDGINAVTNAMSSQIVGMIKGTTSASEAMNALGDAILNSVIKNIVDWGAKELWLMGIKAFTTTTAEALDTEQAALAIATGTAITTASVANAAIMTSAWTPAATAVSIATLGSAAGIGAAAYMEALVATSSAAKMASLPMKDNGGYVPAGGYAIAGEYGAEVVQGPAHITSRRETAKMMGNNSGPVSVQLINNTSVQATATATQDGQGNLIIALEELLPDMVASMASNPKSKMNKALGGVFQMQRS